MPRNHWFSRLLLQGLRLGITRRRLRRARQVESLEDRTLLATFNVTTHLDVVNAGDGVTSLREAVNSANANTGLDTITFASSLDGVQIQLGSQIGIANEITIQGNGANATVINLGSNSRAFVVFSAGVFNLSGVSIINGKSDTGGAIRNAGITVISSSSLEANHASDSGGAIFNVGKLTLINSFVAFNSAANDGGGIAQDSGPARLRILNSTVSANQANRGGGVANILGRASIVSSTIVGNIANSRAGGLYAFSDAQTVTAVNNSIIAGNLHAFGPVPEDVILTTDGVNLTGQLDVANSWANLIGNAASAGGLVNGKQLNIVGVNGAGTRPLAEIVDPAIRNNNGSPVPNHALVLGSVAIDAGLNNRAKDPGLDGTFFNGDDGTAFPTDQRGPGFNRIVNGGKSATVDIGAYEFVRRTDFVVDSFSDVFDGNFSPGEFTLREAIQLANDTAGKQVITFAPLLHGQTILMGGAHLSVRDSLEIAGPANGGLTIDAQNLSRIFEHDQPLTLRNLNLTKGNGTLGSAPSQVGEDGYGGAINGFSPLTVINCSLFGNTSTNDGGAIWNSGDVKIINSTISGNTAGQSGGGISSDSGGLIANSTITGNRATGSTGGGIYRFFGSAFTLNNTIVAGNFTGMANTPGDLQGTGVVGSNNIIGDAGTSGGLTNGVNNNIVGVGGAGTRDITTILNTTLTNNGGNVRTHALVPNSPALNAGSDALAVDELGNPLTSDGRGAPYLRFGSFDNPVPLIMPTDIGAYQEQPTLVVNTLVDETNDPNTFSLREAITQSNLQKFGQGVGGIWDTITFKPGLAGTITLNGTQLQIDGSVRIAGPGANVITISGNNASRILLINSDHDVEISGLKLILGNAGDNTGGAIRNGSDLTLRRVWITGNKASYGGGISHNSATLTLIDSTVSGNSAEVSGGGIANFETMRIVNSTISGNSAKVSGGGIFNFDQSITIINSTIVGNRADADGNNSGSHIGGGIWTFDDDVTFTSVHNSIIAGNVIGIGNNPDDVRNKPLEADSAFNIIGHAGSAGGLTHGKLGNIVGVNGAGTLPISSIIDTNLSTHPAPVHELIPGSLALNSGAEHLAIEGIFGVPGLTNKIPIAFDQVGNRRVIGTGIDRGAHEFASLSDIGGWNTATGKWYFGENNGLGINQILGPGWSAAAGWDIHRGDFTGDGITDVAGRTDGGAWFVIDGATGISSHWGNWGSDATQKWNDPAFQGFVGVADMNGDGKDDVIGKNHLGHIYVSISSGTSFGSSLKWGAIAPTGYVAHRLGDFNGDGLADVVSFRSNGDRWVNHNSGMNTLTLAFYGNFGSQATKGWKNFMVGDFNNNGFDDIIQQDQTGVWTIGYSTGQGKFAPFTANKWDPNAFSDFHVGDFNGDGRNDIIARTATNQFFANIAQPNGSLVTVNYGSLAAGSTFNTAVGDYNGDGIADIMVIRTTDAAFFGLISNGSKFTNKAFGMWTNFNGNHPIGAGDIF